MFVYSLKKFGIINSCYIDSAKNLEYVLVDSPYVYLQEIITVTDIKDDTLLPQEFVLSQNFPNPFNPSTTISYQLSSAGYVTLKVYDLLGREIATLVHEYKQAGDYSTEFRVQNGELASGVYFYMIRVRDSSPDRSGSEFGKTMKMLLIK